MSLPTTRLGSDSCSPAWLRQRSRSIASQSHPFGIENAMGVCDPGPQVFDALGILRDRHFSRRELPVESDQTLIADHNLALGARHSLRHPDVLHTADTTCVGDRWPPVGACRTVRFFLARSRHCLSGCRRVELSSRPSERRGVKPQKWTEEPARGGHARSPASLKTGASIYDIGDCALLEGVCPLSNGQRVAYMAAESVRGRLFSLSTSVIKEPRPSAAIYALRVTRLPSCESW